MINRVALAANIKVGIDALRIHPLRTILSVLGIIIGSASLVATQQQFLSESVAIAVVGTAIGLVLGLLLAAGVTAGFRYFVEAPVYPVLSVATVLLAIASSSAVGLIFGTFPARRAANLPVIAAIAHE